MSSDDHKPVDELAARRQVLTASGSDDLPDDLSLPHDDMDGMNEFEKRKHFNDRKRLYDNHPYLKVQKSILDPSSLLGELTAYLEKNYIGFDLQIDFDRYPFPYGKTQEMEFLHTQWREATSASLKSQLYTKLLRAIKESMIAAYQQNR